MRAQAGLVNEFCARRDMSPNTADGSTAAASAPTAAVPTAAVPTDQQRQLGELLLAKLDALDKQVR